MARADWRIAGLFALVSGGAGATFLMTTVLSGELPDAALLALGLVGAALIAVLASGPLRWDRVRAAGRKPVLAAAIGGALAFWVAPALALAQRATDAPSGSESLFFTTTAWAAITVLGVYFVSQERPGVTAFAGAIAAAAGAAGLLGNWERPSSFAPFVKFPDEELLMLVAGVLFAVGVMLIARAGRELRSRELVPVALVPAAVLAALFGAPAIVGAGGSYPRLWVSLAVLAAAQAAYSVGWLRLGRHSGITHSAAALAVAPIAVTLLSVVERLTGVYGPNPIMWTGAFAGMAACAAGVAVIWTSRAGTPQAVAHQARATVALAVAALACGVALVALFTPALSAVAEGTLQDHEAFRAVWTMIGRESAAGWVALAAAVLALTSALSLRRGEPTSAWRVAAVAALIASVASVALVETSFATWNRWIPAEVQQAYGTEYASLVMKGILDPTRLAAAALAALAAVLVLASRARIIQTAVPADTEGTT